MRPSRELPLTTVAEAERYRRSGAWPDETVYERFERFALQFADKPAVVERHRTLSYRELLDRVRSLSRGLLDAGIGPATSSHCSCRTRPSSPWRTWR